MRKIKGYIFALILCILFMCSGCGNPESQTGQGSPELYQDAWQQADGHAAAGSLPETEALLKEDQVLELGDHMAVCHIHREAVEKGIDGFGSLHLWNPDMSSLVVCADENDIGYWAKEMYAWVEGEWRRIGRFERVYSETEFYEMPGRGMFPYSDGYRELVCLGGEPVEEKRIEKDFYEEDAFWSDTECIWSEKYKNSVRLYPVWPEWENVTTVIGGASIEKYIRVVSEP